jgi:D-cysteine desulfhydrase
MGAEHVRVVAGGTDLLAAMEAEAEAVRRRGGVPYLIPGGASDPLGALGYVGCAREIVWQCHDLDLRFDRIVCASGSGGTQAGLLAGLRDLGIGVAVTGINVSRPRAVQEERVRALASGTLELMGSAEGMPRELVVCLEDWVGPGYSLPTPEMVEAVRLLARTEAVMLDPVYTGKAMAGLIGLARSGQMGSEENVLFLHTGGFAGLFAAPETFLDASSLARTVTVREASRRIAAVAASAC